jgi:hypothetical protein
MINRDYGRIDWKPRLRKYRAIWYAGYLGDREIALGNYNTREEAARILQAKIKANK